MRLRWVIGVDLRDELMKKLLIEAAWEWLEKNRSAIGDKWYEKISKHLRRADSEITDKARLMGYALWLYNIVSNFAVESGISRRGVAIHSVPPIIDEKTTRRLLVAIQMSIW
ncbi:MAG: hypothetical protein QXK11_11510 [Pyrobaculum sp.]|uniref:hypothetical protein n=1 Tax=Pyrobaculum sp. TaxID=2004705 RepID=UPI00316E8C66